MASQLPTSQISANEEREISAFNRDINRLFYLGNVSAAYSEYGTDAIEVYFSAEAVAEGMRERALGILKGNGYEAKIDGYQKRVITVKLNKKPTDARWNVKYSK